MKYDPRFRRTKIVATVGPASSDEDVIQAMIEAGVAVMRINSSHGTPEFRGAVMDRIRNVRDRLRQSVAILVDLQGPRIRVGALAESRQLVEDGEVSFAPEDEATGDDIPTTYGQLAEDVTVGTRILLDDGLLEVTVTAVHGAKITCRVVHGGELKSHKGMNLPDIRVSAPSVTEKDRDDIALAVEHGADFVGLSFVRRHQDVESLRGLLPAGMRIVSKIEKAAALEDLTSIVDTTDAIMVARGDLGVELPFEEVPVAQKRVISLANQFGRPVITATQMLESMIEKPRPTRAEASDVANAVLDGTDAVMLSAETAVGAYPVEAVQAMARIVERTESAHMIAEIPERQRLNRRFADEGPETADAIAAATCAAAEMLRVPLIVCFTHSGFTARKLAACRPSVPIIGLTTESSTFHRLALTWGVHAALEESQPTYDRMLALARDYLTSRDYVQEGDRVVVTAGVPFDTPGTTNLLKVEVV
ncbi:MAG: pyruvate kinase [Gemmatimonadetes bacterium]|nr:pyruvate kinase [Gemmatimonadota bacterium]